MFEQEYEHTEAETTFERYGEGAPRPVSKIRSILDSILEGINKTEPEDDEGWWETSSGAEFGRKKLVELESALNAYVEEVRRGVLKPFRKALVDKGSHPDYHDAQVERLKREWPTLYTLLVELKKEK